MHSLHSKNRSRIHYFPTESRTFLLSNLFTRSHSKSVLKHCIPIVYRRPSTVSVYPNSIFQTHDAQYKSHRYFFSENRLSILGFDSHDVHSKIMKNCANFKKKLKFWAKHFLSKTITYNLKTLHKTVLRLAKNTPKPVKTAKTRKHTPSTWNLTNLDQNFKIL